ncbi:MAG: hypothetical protein QNJ37_14350 [Crocosphaera sp.]|nr:hypothetical protein [Crocosphaera sp.]
MSNQRLKNLRKQSSKMVFCLLLVFLMLLSGFVTLPAHAQQGQLRPCKGLVFSTEEDFLSQGPLPPDGNPLISDGDLLVRNISGSDVQVCARNQELLQGFDVRVDLGLDAVDVIIPDENALIAFSTELDDPNGRFNAGDLLATNGAILPNIALLALFQLPQRENLGLDAIHFIGDDEAIIKLLDTIKDQGRDFWIENPSALVEILNELKVDIWFSTEGTGFSPEKPSFLDGDLLSALTGNIVARNNVLLPPPVPAGLPDRGVDFGLDAVSANREGDRRSLLFSTEILFNGQAVFTDGDILRLGNGIVIPHSDLITPLEPRANFVGLDALHFISPEVNPDPNIQTLCGDHAVADFDGGLVPVGGTGTGLYRANSASSPPGGLPRRPCGEYVPIDGFLPTTGIRRFRVAYRPNGDLFGGVGTELGIPTNWVLYEPHPFGFCYAPGSTTLNTSPDGWMDASDFIDAQLGTLTGCANPGLRLAVWDTNNRVGLGPANKDGHYVLWLEWEDNGGTLHREPFEHHLQLDNTLPRIANFPNGIQIRLPDGSTPVPACGEAPSGSSQFQVWGDLADDYYWNFRLRIRGGLPPASVVYGPHNYYDPDDGSGFKNTDQTGTTPDLTLVHLRNIDMTDLGSSFQDCCYVLDLFVRDAAIRHSFNRRVANDNSGSSAWEANSFVTFAASP